VVISGKTKALESVNLGFDKGGKVAKIGVVVGDLVSPGQVLVELDMSELNASLLQAQANLDAEKAKRDALVKALDERLDLTGKKVSRDVTPEEYDRIMGINTKAVFLACQVFGRYFVERQAAASIINLGSMSGLVPLSRVFTYSMSKAAVHNLSKNLAREWAPLGIRVNTLVPGFFPAEQNKKVLVPERVAKILAHTPMARFGEARELVGAALLLASHAAGSFITGHEMVVDGGYSAMTI
jgi:NAD(P)-dependent dehydrogenase (short-subunit alcohol dehydrogenase family)